MLPYVKVELATFPRISELSSEARFWAQYKLENVSTSAAPVTCISSCPTSPFHVAATSSTRVTIYDPRTCAVVKTISRFKDVAYSGEFRHDGKLLAAGGEESVIRLFDMSSRAVLRTLTGHKNAVRVTKFCTDDITLYSAADDTTVRKWDVPTGRAVSVHRSHEDYVRCLTETDNPNVWVTGSYDHTIKIWDSRSHSKGLTMVHGFPVEAVIPLPGNLIASAGDNQLKIWDLCSGRLVNTLSNHQKTITSLALDEKKTRLLSGSLDTSVKVMDLVNYRVTHTLKFDSQVLSVALAANDSLIAVGLVNGETHLKKKLVKAAVEAEVKSKKRPRPGTNSFLVRGSRYAPAADDLIVSMEKKKKVRAYDQLLKKFEYHEALDTAIATNDPVVISSVMEELISRGSLKVALGNRPDHSLEPLLHFLTSYIAAPNYTSLLVHVANVVLDLYIPYLGQSPSVDILFSKLKHKIDSEAWAQKDMMQLLGVLETILAAPRTLNSVTTTATSPTTTSPTATTALPTTTPSSSTPSPSPVLPPSAPLSSPIDSQGAVDEEEAAPKQPPRKKSKRNR